MRGYEWAMCCGLLGCAAGVDGTGANDPAPDAAIDASEREGSTVFMRDAQSDSAVVADSGSRDGPTVSADSGSAWIDSASAVVPDAGPVDSGPPCRPMSCLDLHRDCGPTTDGCGAPLNCGSCFVLPWSCGLDGFGSLCVSDAGACSPETCPTGCCDQWGGCTQGTDPSFCGNGGQTCAFLRSAETGVRFRIAHVQVAYRFG